MSVVWIAVLGMGDCMCMNLYMLMYMRVYVRLRVY